MQYRAYFIFNGQAKQAIDFYKEVFETDECEILTFADAPQNPEYPLPEEAKSLIMNACLNTGSQYFMFSDSFPGQPIPEECEKVTIALTDINAVEAKKYYEKLKVNGTIIMELQETFWSKAYAQVKDQFGVTWQISADK